MCELLFDFEDINWDKVVDYRLDFACRACEALKDLLDFVGEAYQVRYLRAMIYHGCDVCRVRVSPGDRRIVGTVLWFDLGSGISTEYDSAAGTVCARLDEIECTGMPLSAEAAARLPEMIRDIWREDRSSNAWQKIANENGEVVLELLK